MPKPFNVYTVAGEEFTRKADATARADELNLERADAYRDEVERLEAAAEEAKLILDREEVTLALPAPPLELDVQTVKRQTVYDVVAAAREEQGIPARVDVIGLEDQAAANEEAARLNAAPTDADYGWRGPRDSWTVEERTIPVEDEG